MGCTAPNIDVDCDNWEISAGASFTFHNNLTISAVISKNGNNPWPFSGSLGSGSSIPAGSSQSCQAGTSSGSYQVNGAVKHIIITSPMPAKKR